MCDCHIITQSPKQWGGKGGSTLRRQARKCAEPPLTGSCRERSLSLLRRPFSGPSVTHADLLRSASKQPSSDGGRQHCLEPVLPSPAARPSCPGEGAEQTRAHTWASSPDAGSLLPFPSGSALILLLNIYILKNEHRASQAFLFPEERRQYYLWSRLGRGKERKEKWKSNLHLIKSLDVSCLIW